MPKAKGLIPAMTCRYMIAVDMTNTERRTGQKKNPKVNENIAARNCYTG